MDLGNFICLIVYICVMCVNFLYFCELLDLTILDVSVFQILDNPVCRIVENYMFLILDDPLLPILNSHILTVLDNTAVPIM